MSPSEDMYNALVNCCCKLKMYEEAMKILDTMLKLGLLPHIESYKLLVCGLYDEGNDEMAKSAFCMLIQCGYNYDEVAWKLLIVLLLKRVLLIDALSC